MFSQKLKYAAGEKKSQKTLNAENSRLNFEKNLLKMHKV